MENNIFLRAATLEDAAAIARLEVNIWWVSFHHLIPAAHLARLSYDQQRQSWQRNLAKAGAAGPWVYVAVNPPGQVVGFAAAGPERTGKLPYAWEVYSICVLESWRRRKLATQLLLSLAVHLKVKDCRSLILWTPQAALAARGLCEAQGGHLVYQRSGNLPQVAYAWEDVRSFISPSVQGQAGV